MLPSSPKGFATSSYLASHQDVRSRMPTCARGQVLCYCRYSKLYLHDAATGLCIIVCSFRFATFCLLVFAVVEMWQCHIPTIPPSTANCKQMHWCWSLNLHLNIYTTFRRRHILIYFGQNSKIFRRQIESTNLRTRPTTHITMEVRNRS
jgi:hypothetical protein